MKRHIAFWMVIATAAFTAWLFSDHVPFQREVTVYLGWCPQPLQAGACLKGEEAGNSPTYRAMSDIQTVIYWHEGQEPHRFATCAVRDSLNWFCSDGPEHEASMVDGRFFDQSSLNMYYQVSKARWWWLSLNTRSF